MKLTGKFCAVFLLTCCFTFGAGFRECGGGKGADGAPKTEAEKQREAEEMIEGVATGLYAAASGVEIGVPTVRAFREQGKLKPESSLKLARGALVTNNLMREAVAFMLEHDAYDEQARRRLADQIKSAFDSARRLQSDGTIRLPSGEDQLVFNLIVAGGETALRIAASRLASVKGLRVPLTAQARADLESAKAVIERNEAVLKDAVALLERAGG